MACPLRICRPVYNFLLRFSVYVALNKAQLLNEVSEPVIFLDWSQYGAPGWTEACPGVDLR